MMLLWGSRDCFIREVRELQKFSGQPRASECRINKLHANHQCRAKGVEIRTSPFRKSDISIAAASWGDDRGRSDEQEMKPTMECLAEGGALMRICGGEGRQIQWAGLYKPTLREIW